MPPHWAQGRGGPPINIVSWVLWIVVQALTAVSHFMMHKGTDSLCRPHATWVPQPLIGWVLSQNIPGSFPSHVPSLFNQCPWGSIKIAVPLTSSPPSHEWNSKKSFSPKFVSPNSLSHSCFFFVRILIAFFFFLVQLLSSWPLQRLFNLFVHISGLNAKCPLEVGCISFSCSCLAKVRESGWALYFLIF